MSHDKTTLDGDEAIARYLTANGFPCSSDSVRKWRTRADDPLPSSRFFRKVLADPWEVLVWAQRQAATAARERSGALGSAKSAK